MSEANGAATTKQLIVSIVAVGVMLATADQVGRHFLIASVEKNLEKDIDDLKGGQKDLNERLYELTGKVAKIEGSLSSFTSAENRARARQAPLKSEADRVQIAP